MLLLALLLAVSPASAAESKRAAVGARTIGAANLAVGAGASAPTITAAPGQALSLLPRGPNLGLDPRVVGAMGNPVPATAVGLPAAYFAQPQAAASAIAGAAGPQSTQSVEQVADKVYDGGLARPAVSASQPVSAEAPVPSRSDYLREVRGLSGHKLLGALKPITARKHQDLDYNAAKEKMFSSTERVQRDGQPGVIDAYSGVFVPARGTGNHGNQYIEGGDRNGDGRVSKLMTAEHVVPQSILDEIPAAKGDLHNLIAAWEYPNERRGSLPFGYVQPHEALYKNNGGARFSDTRAQPPEVSMGKIARIVFYMAARRPEAFRDEEGRRFLNASLPALMEWNAKYPPTAAERRRNDLIEAAQGNRNPFVDDPALAALVWGAEERRELPHKNRPSDKERRKERYNRRPAHRY